MSTSELGHHGRALPTEARQHNRASVLQVLFRSGPTSRAQLSRITGLTRASTSAVVEQLINDGLVEELGAEARSGRAGKPATLLGLQENGNTVIAVDLSESNQVTTMAMALSGRIIDETVRPFDLPKGDAGVDAVEALCRDLIAGVDGKPIGIGIATPGICTPEGVVVAAPNLGWFDVPLAERLRDSLGVPVFVANDASCAALGEFTFGGATSEDVEVVLIGKGVGAGMIINGSLVHGSHNAAGEIGHVTISDSGRDNKDTVLGEPRECACGRTGCLETLMSIPAFERAKKELSEEGLAEYLAAIGERFGIYTAAVVGTTNIAELIICGPEEFIEGPFIEAAAETMKARTFPTTNAELVVRLSDLEAKSALLGGGVLVLSRELGIA